MMIAAPIRDLLPPQHLRARIVLIAALVPLGFVGLAAHPRPAAANEVHFDPESPAGKEYALPLDQARNEGAGKTGVGKDGSIEPAPLFGEGVSGGPPTEGGETRSSGAGSGHGHGTPGAGRGGSPRGGSSGGVPSRFEVPQSGGYSTTTGLGLLAAILILGAGLGLGLRGLQRARPS